MTVRPLRSSDIPILQELAERSGFPYPPDLSHPHIEAVLVAVDSEDRPIIAVAAKRLVEIYGYVDSERSPVVLLSAWKLLHGAMAQELRNLSYNSVEAFLPPSIAEKFGRRLERTFGWVKNHWSNWAIRF